MPPCALARIARLVIQRGNRRQAVFFGDEDYALYRDLLSTRCRKAGVEVWSCCLMPNPAHLILTPSTPQRPGFELGETHRRYCSVIHAAAGDRAFVSGAFWFSCDGRGPSDRRRPLRGAEPGARRVDTKGSWL